jgi:N-methylhydantoinase A
VDIGGTHTDAILVDNDGVVWRGKALTTHKDYSNGILASAEHIASQIGSPLSEVLSEVTHFVNGTTVGTNVVAELRGAKVGLLTTKGFEDTLFLSRMPRGSTLDLHKQLPLPELVGKDQIRGITERVDRNGDIVVELDEEGAREAIQSLLDEEVEEIAVCLLWSFTNATHEQRLKALIAEIDPEITVTLSSDLMPVIREYERMVPTVLNGYVGPRTRTYLETITNRAAEESLGAQLLLMNARGGFTSFEEAKDRPVNLIGSGPAAGVVGAQFFGKLLGIENIVCADVGGTSFDVATMPDLKVPVVHRIEIGPFHTAMSAIGVDSIGTGGGSIAWIDARGVLNVGPKSAGSEPGPACYGRGGTEPTVTDALVALGMIQPDRYLGGRVTISRETAEQVIEDKLVSAMGGDVTKRAADIVRIALTQCAGQLALSTVEKGYDPRQFTMFVYGGLGSILCPLIAQEVGIKSAVIPQTAAQFSAFGLLTVDRQVEMTMTRPWILPEGADLVEETFQEMEERGKEAMRAEGFDDDSGSMLVQRSGDFSFAGQQSEFNMELGEGPIDGAAAESIRQQFIDYYERLHGAGTAWTGVPVQMVNQRVRVVGVVEKPDLRTEDPDGGTDARPAKVEDRNIYVLGNDEVGTVEVYDWKQLKPGMELDGPAIVAGDDTTVYVPPNTDMKVDQYMNLVLDFH